MTIKEAPPQEPTAPKRTLLDKVAIFMSEQNLRSHLALNLAVEMKLQQLAIAARIYQNDGHRVTATNATMSF